MPRQQVQGGSAHHRAVLLLLHRQHPGIQGSWLACSQLLKGLGRELVVQPSRGRPPLHAQPKGPIGTRSGRVAGQHLQGQIRGLTGQQPIGIGQHHRQGLGGGLNHQQPLLQHRHRAGIPLGHGRLAGRSQLVQGSCLQKGLQAWLSLHWHGLRWERPSPGQQYKAKAEQPGQASPPLAKR